MYGIKEFVILVAILALGHGHVIELRNSRIYESLNTYYFYSRSNRNPVIVPSLQISTATIPLDVERPTIFLVHDALGSHDSAMNSWVRDAYLTNEDYDIIVLDWQHVASLGSASIETAMVSVAQDLAAAIETFVTAGTVAYNNLHLIGHGHGAHLVGMAGRLLLQPAARITGLNPSGGIWVTSTRRLISTDANYVETIRTDTSGNRAIGMTLITGHADIYANSGTSQPGCSNNVCNHDRSYELFAASLTDGGLVANRCTDLQEMTRNRCTGFTFDLGTAELFKWGSGIYRVNTGRIYPYVN